MSSRFLIALGKAIKHFRIRKKWTQLDLVRAMIHQDASISLSTTGSGSDGNSGITQGYLSKIENGSVQIANDKMKLIADALDVSMRQIWEVAEELEKFPVGGHDPQEFLDCLVDTNIPADEVAGLVAEVDVNTLAVFQSLTTKIQRGEFCSDDLERLDNMLDRLSVEPTVQLRNYSKELGQVTKVMGEKLVSLNKAQRA